MSFQFLPFYTGDYLRDTRHLSPLKHGIYLLLLMHCWDQKGPLPLDEQECSGIANCRSSDEIEALRYVLDKYFVRMEDGHYNARMQKEVERAEALSHARSEAGRRGYQAKAKQLPSKSQAIAKQVPLPPHLHHTPTPTPTPIEQGASAPRVKTPDAKARRTPVPESFGISDRVRAWAAEKGHDRLEVHLEAFKAKCRAHGYTYVDHDAAFMEAIRGDWAKVNAKAAEGTQDWRNHVR